MRAGRAAPPSQRDPARRPKFLVRRRGGELLNPAHLHRDEREIIARDNYRPPASAHREQTCKQQQACIRLDLKMRRHKADRRSPGA